MKLFQITDAVERIIIEATDRETGEISEEGLAALDDLPDLRDKLVNCSLYLKGILAERDAVKKASKELADRASIHGKQADRLRDYIARHAEIGLGYESISDPRVKLSWRTSTAVVVDADASLPVELLCVKTSPDKKAIGDLLKAGTEVEGCRLETRKNLQVK